MPPPSISVSPSPLARWTAFIALLALGSAATAQVTTDSSLLSEGEEPLVLAPFEVSSSGDVGYLASSTLAGSRMNSDLRDTAATISVMTAEFLADLGATDLTEALAYGNNVQQNLGDETEGDSNGNSVTEFYANYRIRGIQANTARNYFTWNLPSDFYNVERVDESRGPNSILFGIGSAGGIINTSTKVAKTNASSQVASVVFSSHDSKRISLDVNQVLVPNKLAMRLNVVHDDSKSFRLFTGSEKNLADLAVTWRPFKNTTVRLEGETGSIDAVITRPWGLIDRVSVWEASGSPISSAPSATMGTSRLGTLRRVSLLGGTDTLVDFRQTLVTTVPTAVNQVQLPGQPSSINPTGPGGTSYTEYSNYNVTVEQKLGERTYAQLSYNHQEYDFTGYDPAGGESNNLFGDPNATVGGVANPHAGQYFLDTNWFQRNRNESFDTFRATLSSEFDLGSGGRHRIAAMAEQQKSNYWRTENREYWVGAPFNATPENNNNLVWHRNYVDLSKPETVHVAGGDGQLIENLPFGAATLSSAWLQRNANINDDDTELNSVLIGDQSYFFDNRLVLTAGYRRDEVDISTTGNTRDAITREIILDYGNVERFSTSGNTRTLGAVAHLGGGVSLLYNNSNSLNLANAAHRILPDSGRAPNWDGEGEDYGVQVELFDQKLSARLTRFTSSSRGETDFRNIVGIVTNRNDRILAALEAAGEITSAEVTAHTVNVNTSLSDRDSSGYELSVVANPTEQWSLSVNYSYTDSVSSNNAREVLTWADENITYWQQFDTNVTTATSDTIAAEIANLRDDLDNLTSVDGRSLVGNRQDKFNVFTRYDLSGPLRGFYVGGGYRFQSGMVMGADVNNVIQYSDDFDQTDFLLGYRRKLGDAKSTLTLQLNVSNLFDADDPIVTRRTTDNLHATRVILRDGRAFRFTATLKF